MLLLVKRYFVLNPIMVLVLVLGCGVAPEPPIPPVEEQGEVLRSEVQRVTNPQVSQAVENSQVMGNTDFSMTLMRELGAQEGNLFLSGHSISTALAMTYAGAKGTTATQMAQTLGFGLAQGDLHSVFNALDLALSERGQGAKASDGTAFRLRVVNAIWGQKGYSFLGSFLDELARNYDAGMRVLDYVTDPEVARTRINGWVAKQTEDRIPELIPQGAIDGTTRLVLTNAVYFNAAWAEPFSPDATSNSFFNLADGTIASVPTMHSERTAAYAANDTFRTLELPYDGNELSMVLILPEAGAMQDVEQMLTAEKFATIVEGLQDEKVDITLPKFEFSSRFALKKQLAALGMTDAFDGGLADFSGMDGSRRLYIGNVIHKAFIKVDEAGTEAAAATAVLMSGSAAPTPDEVKTFHANRPFLFFIRDRATGVILFSGRMSNPS